MRKALLCVVVAVLVLGLTGAVATAKNPVVEQLQVIEATPLNVAPYVVGGGDCQVGNLNAPAYAISNFLYPPEDYKLVFDPLATCSSCPLGINVMNVHVFLQTSGANSLVMSVDVEEAIYPTPGCASPGPEWCTSPSYQVNLPQAGLWDVNLPISCNCLAPTGKYLLSVHFESSGTPVPALITDAGPPLLCTNWNNYGLGWDDLVGTYAGWPGQLKTFADVECCSPPVPVKKSTWGAIKSLYKN